MRLRRSSRTALVGFMIVLGAVSCRSDGSADIMPADIMPADIGPQENGVIVFSGLIEDDFQLFSIHKDGSDLRQLTDDATMKTALAGSPDGSRIAYAAYGNELTREEPAPEFTSIYTIRVDGTDRTTLCEACSRTAYGSGPSEHENDLLVDPSSVSVPDSLAWSPDSSLIAAPAVFSGVLLMDAETGRSSTIPTPEPVTALAWSPDGKRLALSHTWFAMPGSALGTLVPRDGTEWPDPREHRPGGIYLLDVETGELEEVLSTGGMAHVHGWSPDGELFAYTFRVSENRHSELAAYSITEDRSWPLVEAEFGQAGLGSVWSPAGDRIAALTVQYDEQSAKDLWLVSSDGTTRSELPVCRFEGADGGDQCAQPTIAWSPDGTTVVYQAMLRGRPVGAALILQDVEGPTNVVRLGGPSNDIGVGSCCLVWLPAS